jgi:hypothetical protein
MDVRRTGRILWIAGGSMLCALSIYFAIAAGVDWASGCTEGSPCPSGASHPTALGVVLLSLFVAFGIGSLVIAIAYTRNSR